MQLPNTQLAMDPSSDDSDDASIDPAFLDDTFDIVMTMSLLEEKRVDLQTGP